MNAFVIVSEAKDLTTRVANTKRLSRDHPFGEGCSPSSPFGMTVGQLTEHPK